jgi:DNA-binding SARP family transcriptional activator
MDAYQVGRLGCPYIEHLDAPVVHLFGGPYVTVGARRQEVPEGSKQLLAFVALRGRRVERRQAAGTLWPLGDEARAAGNLRSALWRLRRVGIEVLIADKCSLALSAGVLVDLHLMDQWARRLIDGAAFEDDLTVSASWADALDLLPDWYDDWALMERERVRQQMLHALEALSRTLARAGRLAEAVETAILAVSADPLSSGRARSAHLSRHTSPKANLVDARHSYSPSITSCGQASR